MARIITALRLAKRFAAETGASLVEYTLLVALIAAQLENAETVYLYSLWLDPAARGRGLARPLVAKAVDWARVRRARTVTLRVAADNAVARGIYKSLGFTLNPAESPSDRGEVAMILNVR